MKQAVLFFLAVLLNLTSSYVQSASGEEYSNYRLGSGDRISITVFDEKDLSLEKIRLSDAGTISYPMLGEIKVLGLTVSQLEKLITDKLKGRYLVNPQVTITIDEYRQFFVNGMVKNPGGFSYQPGLTVRKAVSLAGGFQDRADRDSAMVIHDNEKVPRKEKLDAPVEPGDTITIEESFF